MKTKPIIDGNWDENIQELRQYFNFKGVDTDPLVLNAWTKIENPRKFVRSHLAMIISQNGNKTYQPYLERLYEFMQYLEKVK